jgi:cellulose 1,4-beta-cellobiosidase
MHWKRRWQALVATSALVVGSAALAVTSTSHPASAATRLDNPYVGATPYVNPEWAANATSEPGGSAIANQPTYVWLDRMAAINGVNGSMGLRAHLDKALQEGANLVQLVIYDLPGRDCAALASNGELGPTDIDTYEHSYIDPIATILSDSKYANLRIVNVVEPDSLPNLVTNASGQAGSTPQCATMLQNGNYVKGVGYALAHLGALPNVYNYIDAGHHGWLGWDSNLGPFAQMAKQAATSTGSTVDDVAGFVVNTANYSALKEPYFSVSDTVNGTTVRQSKWVDWNNYVDEQSFAGGLRSALISQGFSSSIGMLIDTSRNGWGGSARPTGPGPKTSVDDYVNGSRIDRRIHPGNWCNQSGSGLGERPTAAPTAGIDAYVWVKPPGESDGSSTPIANDEGKGFDQMCDPTYAGNARNGNNPTGALSGAPLAGHWFSAMFRQLLANAYPPLDGGGGTTTGGTTTGGTTTGGTTTGGTTTGGTTTGGTTTGGTTTGGTTTGGTTGGGGGSATCAASYHVDNDWGSGFTATVTITNNGSKAITAWQAGWAWAGNQLITNSWSTTASQSGKTVTAKNAPYNGGLAAGSSTTFGFQASYSGSNATPTLSCTAS